MGSTPLCRARRVLPAGCTATEHPPVWVAHTAASRAVAAAAASALVGSSMLRDWVMVTLADVSAALPEGALALRSAAASSAGVLFASRVASTATVVVTVVLAGANGGGAIGCGGGDGWGGGDGGASGDGGAGRYGGWRGVVAASGGDDVAAAGDAPSTTAATAPAAANSPKATTTRMMMQQRRLVAGGFLSARTLFAPPPGSDREGPRSVTTSPVVDLTTSKRPPLSVPVDELSLATDLARASLRVEVSETSSR